MWRLHPQSLSFSASVFKAGLTGSQPLSLILINTGKEIKWSDMCWITPIYIIKLTKMKSVKWATSFAYALPL